MKHYIYIMGDSERKHLHVAFTEDIQKAITMYESMPTLRVAPYKLLSLIHLEEANTKEDAENRFKELFEMTLAEKLKLVKTYNPDLIELKVNIHINL